MSKSSKYFNLNIKAIWLPLIFIGMFFAIGFWRFFATGSAFYILNFGYIGTAIAIGMFLGSTLKRKYADWGRRITQVLVGVYMLGFLGFYLHENMQIEGFFVYLMLGVFAGATLHYLIAKIAGVVIFGRGWCGYACWTAMVLDFLPWKKNKSGRHKGWGWLRYLHFALSLALVLYLWFTVGGKDAVGSYYSGRTELIWLIIGNLFYYTAGIVMAATLKDNRAFCKYLCPIPTLLKVGSRLALFKVSIDAEKCIDCGKCEKFCPMDIKLLDYKNAGQRVLSTECILCNTCANVCPTQAITQTFKLDCGTKERLNYKKKQADTFSYKS